MYIEWKLVLVRFKIVLVSAKVGCTVCAKCNSGMEIALGTPRWYSKVMYVKLKLVLVHLGIALVSERDRCMVCAECKIGPEIILDAPDGTPTSCGLSESIVQSVWR